MVEDETNPTPSLVAAALSQIAEGVILADATGRILFVNDAAARMHGMARLDVTPDRYAETYQLLTEAGRPYPSEELPLSRAVLRGETVTDERWRIRRPNGSEILAVGTARPIVGPAGERLGAVLTLRDDTHRVAAERAERRSARVLEQIADEHLTMDADFRILSVNRAALRGLGKPAETFLGRTHWEAFPASVGTEAERQYRRVAEERVEVHFAHHYVGEGYDRHIEIDAYPTEEGGVAVFWRDVSARVHAEQELLTRNAELSQQAVELETANAHLEKVAAQLEARTREAERARAEADEAGRRLAFLAEATARLATSLDYETTLRQIVALAVPAVSEWASYTVDGGDGTVRLLAIGHADPERAGFVHEVARRFPIRMDEPAGAARVLRTGVAELIEEIPDDVLQQVAQDAEHLDLLRSIGFRSLMTVPVIAQGRVLGALGFGTGESGRRFGADDLSFAEELARRAAVAIDNARLFQEVEAARREAERERRNAEEILESITDSHFVLDADFRFTSANAAMERAGGVSRDALLGRSIWEAFPGMAGTIFERSYRQVARQGTALHFVGEYRANGLDVVAEVDAYPTPDGGVAVFWRDVGPRRRMEAALAESERRFRTLADAMPALAWTARPDGHIDWYNARWYEYTGTTPEQMKGWGWQAVHDPTQLPAIIEQWQASLATATPFEMTFPLLGADGAYRRFLTRVVPVCDADGRVLRWVGTNADVEAERIAREEAERQRAEAEAANKAKGEFLSTMSHELRTPLNAIAGYVELIEMGIRGPVTEAQREDLARVRASQRHLLGLIDEVLNYAKLDTGAAQYEMEDVALGEVLGSAEALVAPQARAKSLQLGVSCPAELTVRADAEKLRQILVNLLNNAVKFTGHGGRVDVACGTAGDLVQVEVRDTGIGIPADQLERIFEAFVQVRSDLARPHEGTGLGLAISRELARGMGGDLTVESTPGQGSTFTVSLCGPETGVVPRS